MDLLRFLLMVVSGIGFGYVYHVAVPVVYNVPADPVNTFIAGMVGCVAGILIGMAGDLLARLK